MAIHTQAMRYAVVGILSNLALYIAYLAITALGASPIPTMTGLYLLGVLQTFIFNKRWTFEHQGNTKLSLFRYITAYCIGYVLNLSMLKVMVDQFGFPHQIVQALAVVVVAITLFILQRYWVFASHTTTITPDSSEYPK